MGDVFRFCYITVKRMTHNSQPPRECRTGRDANADSVLAFVAQYIHTHGHSPSQREIGAACFMSRSNVVRYLDLLEAWGYIRREPGVPRTISLIPQEPGRL